MSDLNYYLDNLGKQGFTEEKKSQVNRHHNLDFLCELYLKAASKDFARKKSYDAYEFYSDILSGIKYSAKNVHDFTIELPELYKKTSCSYIGKYLSALINNCKHEQIKIMLFNYDWRKNMSGLGFLNNKDLLIYGNPGNGLGRLQTGRIIVYGNTEAYTGLGQKEKGRIIINGNVSSYTGMDQEGTIIVNGNAGDQTGLMMRPTGVINVNGYIEGIGTGCEGNIYQNGVRIR
ncbi:hypothetical protein HY837_03380 [archaeon]|nr:hypothetical protein [archaeon]